MDKKLMKQLLQEKKDLLDSITRKEMPQLQNKNIILIDDSPETITILSNFLKKECDYSIKSYTNEFEALEEIAKQSPDLIIMDIGLQTINGLKLTNLVHNLDSYKNPILYISATASYKKDLENLFGKEVAFLTKPINKKELLHTIEKLLK